MTRSPDRPPTTGRAGTSVSEAAVDVARRVLRGAAAAALALAAFSAPVAAQSLPASTVEAVDAAFSDIDASGPGCAAGVAANGTLLYGNGFGMANLDYGIPITTRSNFYLGSVGKQFTAAAVLHAARAGHLSLDDPLRRWIPELPEYERPVTVRHLVHHTSGIRDYLTLGNLAGWEFDAPHSTEQILELLARQRAPNFAAGDEELYSNSGYLLLAQIVERATGRSLRRYLEEEFFGPLGMERTRVHDDRLEPMPDRVVGYQREDGEIRMNHPWAFDQVGSGGVYSSIDDLVRWDRNFYTEEVGGAGFTEALLQRGVLADGDTLSYAFGLGHGEYRGLRTVSHGGALAGFRSELLRFPDQETTVLVLCNFPTSNPGARARRVADAVLADRLEPAELAGVPAEADEGGADEASSVTLSSDELDAFVGPWLASIGVEVEILREDDGLVFRQGEARMPITIVSASVLTMPRIGVTMTFSEMRGGRYHHQDVVQNGQPFTAERMEADAAPYSPADVAGAYHSDELDVTYSLSVDDDGGLTLSIPGGRSVGVRVLGDGRIRAPFGFLEPELRDGRVVAFVMDAGRVRGIRFERR